MKLKELPKSYYNTLRLALKPITAFQLEQKKEVPVIVSLTSIPSRLKALHIVIRSLFDQSVRPKKIILWLNESMKEDVPKKLTNLEGEIFEICFTPLKCSHKKLIHSIPLYPALPIITCDDDFIYYRTWLESLFQEHLDKPNTVLANHVRTISHDASGEVLSYKQWIFQPKTDSENILLLAIGGKGVLYPPKALDNRYADKELFLKLAPKADDLWFKAMELLKGTPVRLSERTVPEPIPIAGSQKISLKKENIGGNKNKKQWEALEDYFSLKQYY